MRFLFLQISAVCVLVAGAPSRRAGHVVHERRAVEPVAWVKARRLEAHTVLPLRIGLTQQNTHELEEILISVSHPSSPTYGDHWSPERVLQHFAPSKDTISTVKSWLVNSSFHPDQIRLSPSMGWIDISATTSEVESLLNTEYHVYIHPSGHEQISCESYSVPEYVREHVDLIKPTVHFAHRIPDNPALFKRATVKPGDPTSFNGTKTNGATVTELLSLEDCDKYTTPECLRKLYSINYKPQVPDKNSFGIVEFTPQAYLGKDLDLFFANFSKDQKVKRPVLVSINGSVVQVKNQSIRYNAESDLDLEYAMALTDPIPISLLQIRLIEGVWFDSWLEAVDGSYCNDPDQDGIPESCGIIQPPNVVSISYVQDESTVPVKHAKRQCNEYGKLGLMGSTILYGSGDDGVAGYHDVCLDANNKRVQSGGTKFNPAFPATCPFVTAVGATQVNPGSTVFAPESACEQYIYSGGGFSNIFPMPEYQKQAVTNFLKNHPPPYTAEQYNNSGMVRGFPDLSANGANYVIAVDGKFITVYGTSASAPVVASIITLINDARLAKGGKPLGFINPLIYDPSFSIAFHDITDGGNQGCGTAGFNATEGWDPVTGVGTPNMDVLLAKLVPFN